MKTTIATILFLIGMTGLSQSILVHNGLPINNGGFAPIVFEVSGSETNYYYGLPDEEISLLVGETDTIFGYTLIDDSEISLTVDYSCDIGSESGNNYVITPSSGNVGDHTLTITFKNGATTLFAEEIQISVYEKETSGSYGILEIGDSTLEGVLSTGDIDATLSDVTLDWLGTQGSTYHHEGRSGWTFEMYVTDSESPFVSDGVFDIESYFIDNSIADPDIVYIRLGINDVTPYYLTGITDEAIETILEYADTLIDGFLAYNSTLRVIVALPTICTNSLTLWQASNPGTTPDIYIRSMHQYWEQLVERYANDAYDTRVSMSYEAIFMNRDNGYNDDVHPNALGYSQLAVGVSGYFNKVMHEISSFIPIIADHTVVDLYDDIPSNWIDSVKKMWLAYPGESHSYGIRYGLSLVEALDSDYDVNVTEGYPWVETSPDPEAYTTSHLRVGSATWGDHDNSTGWIYWYGEEDWWTNSTAISQVETSLSYCNSQNLHLSAIGFGWCWDPMGTGPTASADPVYGAHWWGSSVDGPSGDRAWGLDADDYSITSNSVSMDTYLSATQGYIDYCESNDIPTKVFFTTGPVDTYNGNFGNECMYQAYLKYEHIRGYVASDENLVLFDYADILCYDDDGTPTTISWNGHTFPGITDTNNSPQIEGHISAAGELRLGKAMWWLLARIAGWDGVIE